MRWSFLRRLATTGRITMPRFQMTSTLQSLARRNFLRIRYLLTRDVLWTTTVGLRDFPSVVPAGLAMTERKFIPYTPSFRTCLDATHTVADPFLFVHEGALFLFAERMTFLRHGEIVAYRSTDLEHWEHLGTVLRERHHLSYPNVFTYEGCSYMLPEGAASGCLWLYRAEDAGLTRWTRVRTLLEGRYYDPTLVMQDDRVYLFATDGDKRLRLFHAVGLFGEFCEHPESPVTSDSRYARCGGPVIEDLSGRRWRLSQDGTRGYGEDLYLNEIVRIGPETYVEAPGAHPLPRIVRRKGTLGMHHCSTATFGGIPVMATDAKELDSLANLLVKPYWQVAKLWRRRGRVSQRS